jgi:hypothetical protein
MARRVQDVESVKPEVVADTVVAGWFTCHRVKTWQVKIASTPEGKAALSGQLREMYPEKCGPARDFFVTRIQKTNRRGRPKSDGPEWEAEYPNRLLAVEGHQRIVAALKKGEHSLLRLLDS